MSMLYMVSIHGIDRRIYTFYIYIFLAQCKCKPGRIGLDCNIKADEYPIILFIDGDGLCDLRISTCDVITIFNDRTLEVDTLSCYFTKLEVHFIHLKLIH
jgi:hypothetical protein